MIRRACALAGLLVLMLQGSSGGHLILVEHTRCAEHGDLVHGDGAHHQAAAEPADAHGPVLQSPPTEGSTDAHEHCVLCADRRDALAVVCEASLVARVTRTPDPLEARVTGPCSGPERFRLAPKNSPPA
jgi:hypothetical protein